MKTVNTIVRGRDKVDFLRKIVRDLRSVGIQADMRRTLSHSYRFKVNFPENGTLDIKSVLGQIRLRQLRAESSFVLKAEEMGLRDYFINGPDLAIHSIRPRIHICRTPEDFQLYNYARLLQSVPSSDRVGREIRMLVWDDGQAKPTLIGALGLASSPYSIACRDSFFHWSEPRAKRWKDIGLRRIMDLALCVSFPPYSFLLGGKLMALLSMTEPVMVEFEEKYGDPLLAVIASCATGIHCPIFNRIMIRKGGLFRRIGQTAGYSTLIYSRDTTASARHLLGRLGKLGKQDRLLRSKSLRVLSAALYSCGVSGRVFLRIGSPKGVYVGYLSENELTCLRKGKRLKARDLMSVETAFGFWQTQLLPKRIANSKQLIQSFRLDQIDLTNEIKKS